MELGEDMSDEELREMITGAIKNNKSQSKDKSKSKQPPMTVSKG